MRDASRSVLLIAAAAALAACSKADNSNNVAIDINNAAPGDIEQLPPDESVDSPSNELVNEADAAGANATANGH